LLFLASAHRLRAMCRGAPRRAFLLRTPGASHELECRSAFARERRWNRRRHGRRRRHGCDDGGAARAAGRHRRTTRTAAARTERRKHRRAARKRSHRRAAGTAAARCGRATARRDHGRHGTDHRRTSWTGAAAGPREHRRKASLASPTGLNRSVRGRRSTGSFVPAARDEPNRRDGHAAAAHQRGDARRRRHLEPRITSPRAPHLLDYIG
jgi:hypothetical protein